MSSKGVSASDLDWLEAAKDQFEERNSVDFGRKLQYLENDLIRSVTQRDIVGDRDQIAAATNDEFIRQLEE